VPSHAAKVPIAVVAMKEQQGRSLPGGSPGSGAVSIPLGWEKGNKRRLYTYEHMALKGKFMLENWRGESSLLRGCCCPVPASDELWEWGANQN